MTRSLAAFVRRWWAALAVCLLLAIVHTWPLATAPGSLSRNDNSDAQLNAWIMAWVAHQLPRDPLRLFEGNIFHPAPHTLTYSEPLIVPALVGAPLAWLGFSPVLVFNIVLILGFALTAAAGYALVFDWTRDRLGSLLAGSMFAFNTHMLTRLAHVQGIHAWGLPLALLATDRVIVRGRLRDALWLALWMTAMAYTSGYLIVFGALMVAVAVVSRITDWWPRAWMVLSRLAVAAIVAGIAVLPVYLPYRQAARELNMTRSLDAVMQFSATPRGYLAAAGTIHYSTWSGQFFRDSLDSFFPGFVVIALSGLAVGWALRGRLADATGSVKLARQRVFMLVAIAATGVVLSLGTLTPVYGWVYAVFPPMQGLRAAARFGNLFLLAGAALAGLGLAALRARMTTRRAGVLLTGLVVAANIESLRAPLLYTRFDGIPRIYSLLAREPGPVVLVEVPFYPPQGFFQNGYYVLNSTAHWRPLMNGYSGYMPGSYRDYAARFWYFPRSHAVDAMRNAGATHVMIHPAGFAHEAEAMWAEVASNPHLERIAVGRDGIALYRLH